MEKAVIRFSRPLFLLTERYPDKYGPVYGFVVDKPVEKILQYIKDYVGYLVGLHLYYNCGTDLFSVSNELSGRADLVDANGVFHTKADSWMRHTAKKCMEKIGLTYSITDVYKKDLKELSYCIDSQDFITSEEFFYALDTYLDMREPNHTEKP